MYYPNSAIYIDLESAPLDQSYLELVMPKFVATRAKKPEKVAEELAEKQAKFLDGAALHWWTAKILTIGLRYQNDQEQMVNELLAENDEATNIKAFFDKWAPTGSWSFKKGYQLIGYNNQSFDCLFLVNRARVHGIKVPSDFLDLRLAGYQGWVVDLMNELACRLYTQDRPSLDAVARAFGVGSKDKMNSAKFSGLWASNKAAALDHLSNDLLLTEAVHKVVTMCRA